MAVPSIVSTNLAVGTTGATLTAAGFGAYAAGDLILAYFETSNANTPAANAGWATWAQIGTAAGAASPFSNLWYTYKIASASETDLVISGLGNHVGAASVVIRGVDSVNPIAAFPSSSNTTGATSNTTLTLSGVTTTRNDSLIVVIAGNGPDTVGPEFSGWTNSNLTNQTERIDQGTLTGNGGCLALWTGELATAGATGSVSFNTATSEGINAALFVVQPSSGYSISCDTGSYTLTGNAAGLPFSTSRRPYVVSSSSNSITGAGTLTFSNLDVGAQNGDLIVISLGLSTTAGYSLPSGWTATSGAGSDPRAIRNIHRFYDGSFNFVDISVGGATVGRSFLLRNINPGNPSPSGGGGTSTGANVTNTSGTNSDQHRITIAGVLESTNTTLNSVTNSGTYTESFQTYTEISDAGSGTTYDSASFVTVGNGVATGDTVFAYGTAASRTRAITGYSGADFIACDTGSGSVRGYDVFFTITSPAVTAQTGSYLITGYDVSLRYNKLVADSGAYSITGNAAGLYKGRTITASSGTYALAGVAASFKTNSAIIATFGAYTMTGYDATLARARAIACDTGDYYISGFDVSFDKNYIIQCETGNYGGGGTRSFGFIA